MKSIIKTYLLPALFIGAMTSSCSGFEDLNINPTNPSPETVDPTFLLTPVLIKSTLDADSYQRIHNLYADTFCQYFANDKYSSNNCVPVEAWTQRYWELHWQWIDALNELIRNAENSPNHQNVVQIARIWKAWQNSRATDLWGDIPYFEAANGSGLAAAYDTQEAIYDDLLKELADASSKLDPNAANPTKVELAKADIVFKGNINRWKQFANSLRLRLAIRLTEVAPERAKKEAEAAVKAEGGLLSSNKDNVVMPRHKNYIFDTRYYYGPAHLFNGKRMTMSKSMEKLLTNLGGVAFPKKPNYKDVPEHVDPRGPKYFNVTNQYNGAAEEFRGRWKGVPSGLAVTDRDKPENQRTNNSRIGVFFIGNTKETDVPFSVHYDRDMILMNYAEVCFLQAEAAARGWNMGKTAESLYNEGIRASMEYMEIDKTIVDQYLTSTDKNNYGTSVKFSDVAGEHNTPLEKIITQKYIANYPDNGWEAWNDYRRLHMPYLDPFVAPETGYVVEAGAHGWKGSVRRIPYPAEEKFMNEKNYEEVVKRIGEDKTTTRVWWDARK